MFPKLTLNAIYGDSHAKVLHTKFYTNAGGTQIMGAALDGSPFNGYVVSDQGPYSTPANPFPYTLCGIPKRTRAATGRSPTPHSAKGTDAELSKTYIETKSITIAHRECW